MCGACGAGSSRGTLHWSAPFLASVPARVAAARTLTLWSRAAGWPGTVTGVASGFEVATPSGRRSLASDLGEVVQELGARGVSAERLLGTSSRGVVEGPPTLPSERCHGHRVPAPGGGTTPARGAGCLDTVGRVLPPDPRRWYRIPGLLAWCAAAGATGGLARVGVRLRVGLEGGMVLLGDGSAAVTCEAVPVPRCDRLTGADETSVTSLARLLIG